MTRHALFRRVGVVAGVVAIGVVGVGPVTAAAMAPASSPPDSTAAGPIAIEHKFGTTELDAPAERIVSLDLQWTDALLAVGVTPVAFLYDGLAGDTGQFPWQDGRLDESTGLDATDSLPLEQIAELDPDLILVGYYAFEQEAFDRLAGIAPTVGMLGDKDVDDWQDQLAVVGEVTGKREAATTAEQAVDDLVTATSADIGSLDGRTYALVNYVAGEGFYVVADPDDGSSRLFYDLGLEITPGVVAVADGATGRAQLSLEQIGLLDADVLILFSQEGDPADLAGYDALPAVQSGAVITLDYPSVVGLNTPTPLSIPYSLELVEPTLRLVAG